MVMPRLICNNVRCIFLLLTFPKRFLFNPYEERYDFASLGSRQYSYTKCVLLLYLLTLLFFCICSNLVDLKILRYTF